ncbi:MAG: hypothetical protein ICV51_12345 [Flavisolibacter sp.]|nr:hypothetical protein [Flavisolibacter sp.]MBD0298421.1 hypothetical protein [Flavisolibacter sp.]MBD0376408.1 hypothetical protein [Flavisolibacter sp.]
MARNEKNNRPEAYPKPTETDQQLNNQPEFVDQEPNNKDKDISDIPVKTDKQSGENKGVNRLGKP